MKVIIAPDSFKGSLTAPEAADAIAAGVKKGIKNAEVCIIPIADGGEGTLKAMADEKYIRTCTVTGPDSRPVSAEYAVIDKLGIVEMASAAGLTLAKMPRRAGNATSYGVGELIKQCLGSGCKRILLTAGGSATNDGGCGMLAALGAKFIRADGSEFVPVGLTLSEIDRIDISDLSGAFQACDFTLAADVKNVLLGKNGAAYIYGPQKGIKEGDLEIMEKGMAHYAEIIKQMTGKDVAAVPSSGAGGGIGVPVMAFSNCEVRSGIEAVLKAASFENALENADFVITGEGRIDSQSLCGKAVSGVAAAALKKNITVYCAAGCLGSSKEELKEMGFADIYTIDSLAENTEDSMNNAARYLKAIGALIAINYEAEVLRKKYG